jgi:hypothetical protein
MKNVRLRRANPVGDASKVNSLLVDFSKLACSYGKTARRRLPLPEIITAGMRPCVGTSGVLVVASARRGLAAIVSRLAASGGFPIPSHYEPKRESRYREA